MPLAPQERGTANEQAATGLWPKWPEHWERLIETIDRLVHHEGYTLRGARQAIEAESRRPRPAASPGAGATASLAARDAGLALRLRKIREDLAGALE